MGHTQEVDRLKVLLAALQRDREAQRQDVDESRSEPLQVTTVQVRPGSGAQGQPTNIAEQRVVVTEADDDCDRATLATEQKGEAGAGVVSSRSYASPKAKHLNPTVSSTLRRTANTVQFESLETSKALDEAESVAVVAWGSVVEGKKSTRDADASTTEGDKTTRDSEDDHEFKVHPEWLADGAEKLLNRRRSWGDGTGNLYEREAAFLRAPTLRISLQEKSATKQRMNQIIMHPTSLKHLMWELVGLALILYDVVAIPLHLVFLADKVTGFFRVMQLVTVVFWVFDIVKAFFTGHLLKTGWVEMDCVKVARRYVKTWFVLDAMCVGVDCVSAAQAGTIRPVSGTMRALRIVRIIKMVRFFKAPEMYKFISEHIRSDTVILIAGIITNLAVLMIFAHLIACFWFWVGDGAPSKGNAHSWVKNMIGAEDSVSEKYTLSLHWSLAQFTGELLFDPGNSTERAFSVVILLFAYLASVMFAGSITTSMTRLMMVAGKQATQIGILRRYLYDNNINASLTIRLQKNTQHTLMERRRNVPENEVELLKIISEPLLVELHFELHKPIINQHPFFDKYIDINSAGVGMVCHMATSHVHLSPGDVVFRDLDTKSDAEARMFWCMRGRLTYIQEYGIPGQMERNDWACEAVLWTRWMHCGTLRAVEECVLLGLNSAQCRKVLSHSPFPQVRDYARSFVQELNQGGRSLHTDMMVKTVVDKCVKLAFPVTVTVSSARKSHSGSGARPPRFGSTFSRPTWFPMPASKRGSASENITDVDHAFSVSEDRVYRIRTSDNMMDERSSGSRPIYADDSLDLFRQDS